MNDPIPHPEDGRLTDIRFADDAAQTELADLLTALGAPAGGERVSRELVKSSRSRTVWRYRLAGRTYYLKRYHTPEIRRRLSDTIRGAGARRELRISRYLRGRGIAAVEVLATSGQGGRAWTVSRSIDDAVGAGDWHDEQLGSNDPAADDQVARTLEAVASLVGRMHAAGVLHRDLHGGSFLLRRRNGALEPVLTDLHRSVRRRRLSRRARASDLATLAHDRESATTRTQRLRLLKHYLRVSGARGTVRGWAILVDHFAAADARRLYARRDREVVERNRYFATVRLGRGWRGSVVLASRLRPAISAAAKLEFTPDDWRAALANPERLLEGPDLTVAKDSRSSRVVRRGLTVGPHTIDVYIKRTRRKHWYKAIVDMPRSSRSIRAFRLGHALITRLFPTPFPLAALDRRTGRFLHESILITEAVGSGSSLAHLWEHGGPDVSPRPRDLAGPLGRVLRALHDSGFAHRDLKATNVLVHQQGDAAPLPVLIDLDGLCRRWWASQRRRFQGLMRLNAATINYETVTRADRLRLLLAYLRRPACGRIRFKGHWHELARRTRRKLARTRRPTP